jgi:RNA polymerase sigma-70 factor (ECF subfamily)
MLAVLDPVEEIMAETAHEDRFITLVEMSEDDLLRQAQLGDEDAFAVILYKMEQPLRRFVRRLIGVSDAEDDIVQDVFIKLYHKLDSIDASQGLKPYLYRMLRNRAYDELRKQGRYHVYSLDAEPSESFASFERIAAEGDEPEEIAHWLMIQLEVQEAMEKLTENQRQCLILFAEEGLSYAEIAEATDTNIGTVKSRLFHAKKNLRRLVRPEVLQALESEFGAEEYNG